MSRNPAIVDVGLSVRRQPSLVDQVTDGISAKIFSGQYPLGEMLPSVQSLSSGWQVSRTVLREALARLSAKGLITSRQGLGVFVAEALPLRRLELPQAAEGEELIRIVELRMAVETEAASLAALRRSQDDVRKMRTALRAMKHDGGAPDMDARVDADLAFHQAIYSATRNEHFEALFAGMSSIIRKNIAVSRRNSAAHRNFVSEAQSEHEAILDAIVVRDRKAASEAARRHIRNTARRLGLALE